MKQVKLTGGRWIVLTSVLGVLSLVGPSPVGPATTRQQFLPFALAGLAYGWAVGMLTWRCVVAPVLDPNVPRARKRRITIATLAIGAALIACALGYLSHSGPSVR